MSNIKNLIQKHNQKYFKTKNDGEIETLCNFRTKNKCPINIKCLVFTYKATIRSENKTKNYLGSTGGTFKKIWYNHISDFENCKDNGTEIWKYI